MLARLAFIAFLWQQTAKVSEAIIALLLVKITSVFLGPEQVGIYSIVGSTMALVTSGVELGFEASSNNFLSRWHDKPNRIAFIVRLLTRNRIVLLLLCCTAVFLCAQPLAHYQNIPNKVYFQLGALIIAVMSLSGLFSFFLLALFRNRQVMLIRTTGMALQLVIAYWLMSAGWGVKGGLIALLAGYSLMVIGCVYPIFKLAQPEPEKVPEKPIYNFGITIWVQNLMNFVIGKSLATLIMGLYLVPTLSIGYFNAAFNVRMFVDTFLILGMGATALAATARLAEKDGNRALPLAWLYNIKATTLLSVPPSIFALFHTKAWIGALNSVEFFPAEALCRFLLVLSIITRVFGGGASATVLQADGKERVVLYQYILGGIVSLVLCLFMIKLWGAYGAAAAVGLGSITTSAMGFVSVKKHYNITFPLGYTLKILTISILASSLTLFFHPSRILSLLAVAIAFTVIFLIFAYIIKPFDSEDLRISAKISNKVQKALSHFARKDNRRKEENT